MEKPENSAFAGKYPVSAYPTLLILDADGKIVHKNVGGLTTDGLIAFGQKAAGKTDTSGDFEKEYAAGNRDPQLDIDYVRALNRANKPSLKITNDYLNAQRTSTHRSTTRLFSRAPSKPTAASLASCLPTATR